MIPLLKESHEFIFIDSQLFNLDVVPYVPLPGKKGDDAKLLHVLMYLRGIAEANNIDFAVDGVNLFLKGGDFPDGTLCSLGFIDPVTKEGFDKLQWDVIPIAGKYLIETPRAHNSYLKQLQNTQRKPFTLEFIIVNYEQSLQRTNGVNIGTFVDINLNAFDSVYNGNVKALVKSRGNQAGFSLNYRPLELENSLNSAITTSLGGLIGETAEILIADSIPYKVSEVSGDGLRVSSQVDFVEAGFGIKVNSAFIGDQLIFDFYIENSSADFSRQVDGLPVVRKRLFKSRKVLNVLESVEIARMKTSTDDSSRQGLPFLRKFRKKSKSTESGTVSVLVRRTL